MKIILLVVACLFTTLSAWAAPGQNQAEIRQAIDRFVRMQTRALPGKVEVKVDEIDRRLHLEPCPALKTFLPPGGRLLGNGTVGVRCPQVGRGNGTGGTNGWTLFVPVHVTVTTTLLVTNRPLPQGKIITADDFIGQSGVLTETGMLTDPAQIIGKVLRHSVGAGLVLQQEMLRDPYLIIQGQNVPVVVEGDGYRVRSEGQALNNAAEGKYIRVHTVSGRLISGIAQENGDVLVRP